MWTENISEQLVQQLFILCDYYRPEYRVYTFSKSIFWTFMAVFDRTAREVTGNRMRDGWHDTASVGGMIGRPYTFNTK